MSNPSYEFIESAIIFGLSDYDKLKSFTYHSKDFAKHGDAFKFVGIYLDKYEHFPSEQVLVENFPTLNPSAKTQSFEYSVDIFKNQVLQRAVVSTVQQQRELVKEDPKQALANIMSGLSDVNLVYDEDIQTYDDGETDRLAEWKERTRRRKMGEGLMGVPTSFKFINQAGIGWMPGELIAAFARPTIGKTWLCVHSAATAVHNGHKTLLISTEMPNTQIAMRLDVTLAKLKGYNFSHRALRHGEEIDVDSYIKFLKEADKQSLLICDGVAGQTGVSLESIAGLIRKHNPKFVVIDGVYLLTTKDTNKAAWEQSHGIFYGLKNLAISTNTPIMVSTQANRDAENVYVPPSAAQVAFGDALIRAADVAVALAKVEHHEDKRLVQFQKYRDGELAIDSIVMQWGVNNGTIEEISDFERDEGNF
tara:strand:+ start:1189 stop:2448 length:1260 start_codon:yes stop_codon:yes gene_type:complete